MSAYLCDDYNKTNGVKKLLIVQLCQTSFPYLHCMFLFITLYCISYFLFLHNCIFGSHRVMTVSLSMKCVFPTTFVFVVSCTNKIMFIYILPKQRCKTIITEQFDWFMCWSPFFDYKASLEFLPYFAIRGVHTCTS